MVTVAPTDEEGAVTKAAERQQRWRFRRKLGRRQVMVDCDEDLILQALIESGRLSETEALDPEKVADAIGEVVREWSAAWVEHAAR
jgi:hypothetical protein